MAVDLDLNKWTLNRKIRVDYRVLKSDMENGVQQVRLIDRIPTYTIQCKTKPLTIAQKEELLKFYTDRFGGYDSFKIANPDDGNDLIVRFEAFDITKKRGYFEISFTLRSTGDII